MPPSKRSAASPSRSRSKAGRASPVPPSSPLAAWQRAALQKPAFVYEFGGPPGAAAIMAGLPLVVLALFFGCGKEYCADSFTSAAELPRRVRDGLLAGPLWSWEAAAVVFGWTLVHFLAYLLLPGPVVPGVVLRDGTRLKYHMNAHLAFWLSLATAHLLPLGWLYDHYLECASAAMALSLLLSIYSYALSYRPSEMLAKGGLSSKGTSSGDDKNAGYEKDTRQYYI